MADRNDSSQTPYISVYFRCCNVYQRIHLNRKKDKFVGWCPKCTRRATVRVNRDADPVKFFYAE